MASGQGSSAGTAVSASLPSVQSGILDPAMSIHAPLTVASFSPPALDLQGSSNTALPPVQSADQVRQDLSSGSAGVVPSGAAVPLALPEPTPLVLLVIASMAYLGGDIGRRRRRAHVT
jgi:hypothetical protein